MRQIASAMLMYINANKGRFPPSGAPANSMYQYVWWWPNELVRSKYINTPGLNVYSHPNSSTQERKFRGNNLFRCPEGFDADDAAGGNGEYPTDALNNSFSIYNDNGTNGAAAEGFGIPSWYMLNSRTVLDQGGTPLAGMKLPGGSAASPFVWWNSTTTAASLQDPSFQRTLAVVRKPAELIMIVEASNPNFYNPTTTFTNCPFGRLGARHGQKTLDKRNAFTNFAFFDGHVGLFPSIDFQNVGSGGPGENFYRQTIFFVKQQRGK
jgi:prepilin-type processing-associated H-X9-DG protein